MEVGHDPIQPLYTLSKYMITRLPSEWPHLQCGTDIDIIVPSTALEDVVFAPVTPVRELKHNGLQHAAIMLTKRLTNQGQGSVHVQRHGLHVHVDYVIGGSLQTRYDLISVPTWRRVEGPQAVHMFNDMLNRAVYRLGVRVPEDDDEALLRLLEWDEYGAIAPHKRKHFLWAKEHWTEESEVRRKLYCPTLHSPMLP